MSAQYELICRPCNVSLELLSEESGNARCPACGVRFDGVSLDAAIRRELQRRKFQVRAEKLGVDPDSICFLPNKSLDDIRDRIILLLNPD